MLVALGERQPPYDVTDVSAALLRGLDEDPGDPATAVARIRDRIAAESKRKARFSEY